MIKARFAVAVPWRLPLPLLLLCLGGCRCCCLALALVFDLPGSLPKRRPSRGKTPKGRRTGTCAVRGRGRMPLPRIPVMDADPERVSAEGARQGVLSFGYFSLHKQRKVTRRKAKAFLLHLLSLSHLHLLLLRRPMDCRSGLRRDMHDRLRWSRLKPLLQTFSPDIQTSSNSKGFRPFGRVTFLCSRKEKVTKRKRALPCALRAARSGSADAPGIRGRGILPLPRTAYIHVRRPSGFSPVHPPLRKGTR